MKFQRNLIMYKKLPYINNITIKLDYKSVVRL